MSLFTVILVIGGIILAAGLATLVALLIVAKVKCGNASKLFQGCLSTPVNYASQTGVRYSLPLEVSAEHSKWRRPLTADPLTPACSGEPDRPTL